MKRRPPPAREYIEGPEALHRFETLAKRMLITPPLRPKARRTGRPKRRQAVPAQQTVRRLPGG